MTHFGPFAIDHQTRTLCKDGHVLPINSRAFDILCVLAAAEGHLVQKQDLMKAVWPKTVVEENNLQVHISALRKVLGGKSGWIVTVPGRGYQLVRQNAVPSASQTMTGAPGWLRQLPMISGIVGREEAVDQVLAILAKSRLMTLTGAGGIGKTTLASAIAQRFALERRCVVPLVQLASLSDRDAILSAIAKSIGCAFTGASPCVYALARMLTEKDCLLLLDNAEHVINDVAAIVETLLEHNAKLRLLVTSREPLHLSSEAVFRVAPLEVPPYHATGDAIRATSAVQLFLSRAPTLSGAPDDCQVMPLIGEICRRLDGLPLAIELAAARISLFGLEGVFHLLDNRLTLLSGGYRTDLPRHQTLRATFDWSFGLLGREAQILFCRSAVFSGAFTLEEICGVLCDDDISHCAAIDGIHELVTKSLVNVEFDGPVAKYRLNESTRAYAYDRLAAEGETRSIASRYGRHRALSAKPVIDEKPKTRVGANPELHQLTKSVCAGPIAARHGDGERDLYIPGFRAVSAKFEVPHFPRRVSGNPQRLDNGHEVFANLTAMLR